MKGTDIKCAVAATNSNGEPDLFYCKVCCRPDQYEGGLHYDAAKSHAQDCGYQSYLVYDELDPAGPALMEHAVWESMDTIDISKS